MAVEPTVAQMALTRNPEFMDRVTAMLAFVASGVLNESGQTPYHQGRAAYAQRVMHMPVQASTTAGPMVCMGINVKITTIYDEETKTSTCTATDPQLESQIVSLFNSLAGLDTPQ